MIDFEARADAAEAMAQHQKRLLLAAEVRAGRMTPEQAAAQAGTTVADLRASTANFGQSEMSQEQVRALGPQGSQEPRGTGNIPEPSMQPTEGHYASGSRGAPASLGATPPVPGASYAGASADGKTIIWTMPDGSRRFTNAAGQGVGPSAGAPPSAAAPARVTPTPAVAPAVTPISVSPPARTGQFATTGLTVGAVEDYQAMTAEVLAQLGFPSLAQGYKTWDPLKDTDKVNEVVGYTRARLDVEGVANALRNRPDLVAINPGLSRGLSREDYYRTRSATETAYGARFGETATAPEVRRRAAAPAAGPAPAEPDWLSQVFQERFTPEESASMFGDYFTRTGRAPSVEEIGLYRTRAQDRFSDRAIEPRYARQQGAPVASELAPRESASSFGRLR